MAVSSYSQRVLSPRVAGGPVPAVHAIWLLEGPGHSETQTTCEHTPSDSCCFRRHTRCSRRRLPLFCNGSARPGGYDQSLCSLPPGRVRCDGAACRLGAIADHASGFRLLSHWLWSRFPVRRLEFSDSASTCRGSIQGVDQVEPSLSARTTNQGGAISSCPAAFCHCHAKPVSDRASSSGHGRQRVRECLKRRDKQ